MTCAASSRTHCAPWSRRPADNRLRSGGSISDRSPHAFASRGRGSFQLHSKIPEPNRTRLSQQRSLRVRYVATSSTSLLHNRRQNPIALRIEIAEKQLLLQT